MSSFKPVISIIWMCLAILARPAGATPTSEIDWIPERIELSCPTGDCPVQVGILLFPEIAHGKDGSYQWEFHDCTASLTGADRITTSGHCNFLPSQGYFVLGTGPAKQIRRVVGPAVFQRYAGVDQPDGPDLAILRLDAPINDIPPLDYAAGTQMLFSELTAYVVNPDSQGTLQKPRFRIDPVSCRVHRHETLFPFNMDERPNLIAGFDCPLVLGNSGAPLFADGQPQIQAVLQGFTDPTVRAQELMEQERRLPKNYETHWRMLATNVRCLDLPDHPAQACTPVTDAEILKRRQDGLAQAIPQTFGRESTTNFSARIIELNSGPDLEVLFEPRCRQKDDELNQLAYPTQAVRLTYDEWARPTAEILQTRVINVPVSFTLGNVVVASARWPAWFAKAAHPERLPDAHVFLNLPLCNP